MLLALAASFMWVSGGSAQRGPAFIRFVRSIETDETDLSNPAGLAFSPSTGDFHVLQARAASQPLPSQSRLLRISPFGRQHGSARIAAALQDPLNIAFDPHSQRLLLLEASDTRLVAVTQNAQGDLDAATLSRYDARSFGIGRARGMTFDASSGSLVVLDAAASRLVRITPSSGGSFEGAAVSYTTLSSDLGSLRGIAWDPTSRHLHVLSPSAQKLYELGSGGDVLAERDLSGLGLKDPQGMVFAPSGDQTDDPAEMSLYVADDGLLPGTSRLPHSAAPAALTQSSGQIVELSFVQPALPEAINFTSSLVRTVNMSAFSPPSPDPSGLTFVSGRNTLLMSDGEVEETVSGITHFQGANVWEMTLGGAVVRTANISTVRPTVVPMSNEPTGSAWNPVNGHYYFSDDSSGDGIYDLNPGQDGLVGTADDSWVGYDTHGVGNNDAEGITYASSVNHLFVADGVNAEVYEYTLTGSLVRHFDVATYGVIDPESVEYNPYTGTLFVLSNKGNLVIVETTLTGALLQTIDVSVNNARAPAGLAYAPASNGSGSLRFYIVDRGIDNNSDPNLIDGKMYEMTAPSSGTVTLTPTFTSTAGPSPTPTFTATITPTFTSTFTPTATPTATIPPQASSNPMFVSFTSNGSVGGISIADEDILKFTGTTWSQYIDGSDVGIGGVDLNAMQVVDASTIRMSFDKAVILNGGTLPVDPWDIVEFHATSTGPNTAGTFSMYFNGDSVDLGTTAENIDALEVLPDGRILISTTGNPAVTGLSGLADEDILAFTPTSLRTVTSGTWALYFDGSDVGLSDSSSEDVDALGISSTGQIYLSTLGLFTVNGVSGDDEDVFVCTPLSLGPTTSCAYSPDLYFDGSTWAQAANDVDAFNLPISGLFPTSTPTFTPGPSNTPTNTTTATATFTPSSTPTNTGTPTNTATASATFTATSTSTPTNTATAGPSPTPTNTATHTPTSTSTNTPTNTSTAAPSATPTATQIPGTLLTFSVTQDSYVQSAKPTNNYGANVTLWVDGSGTAPTYESYLRFDVSGLSGTVQSAVLRVYATSGTANAIGVAGAGNAWTETGITWNTRPPRTSAVVDSVPSIASNTWVDYNVTVLISGNGTYTFVIAKDAADSAGFSSREGGLPAQLVITLLP